MTTHPARHDLVEALDRLAAFAEGWSALAPDDKRLLSWQQGPHDWRHLTLGDLRTVVASRAALASEAASQVPADGPRKKGPRRKLSPLDVEDVQRRWQNGEMRKDIAARYGIGKQTVSDYCRGLIQPIEHRGRAGLRAWKRTARVKRNRAQEAFHGRAAAPDQQGPADDKEKGGVNPSSGDSPLRMPTTRSESIPRS